MAAAERFQKTSWYALGAILAGWHQALAARQNLLPEENLADYMKRMENEGEPGDEITLLAASKYFKYCLEYVNDGVLFAKASLSRKSNGSIIP